MPVRVAWFDHNQDTILEYFSTPWNWGDFYAAQSQIEYILDSSDRSVNLMIDLTNGNVMPSGAFTHLRRILLAYHRNRGMIVIVGAHETVSTFQQMLARLYPQALRNVTVARDLDAALTCLNQYHAGVG